MKANSVLSKCLKICAPLIFTFALLFLTYFLPGCQESALMPSEEMDSNTELSIGKVDLSQINSDRKIIAKELAGLLSDENYRKILEQEIKAANNREDIIEASLFFNKDFNIGSKNIKFSSEMAKRLVKGQGFEARMLKLQKGLIDVYFPIEDHRINWKSSDKELYVAVYDRETIDKNQGFITAFDLTGTEFLIDVSKIPTVPTLVVALSETHGNYPPKIGKDSFIKGIQKNAATASPSKVATNRYLKVGDWFCRDRVGDGFWDAPEYYTSVRHPVGTEPTRTNFYEVNSDHTGYFGLNRVVYTWPYANPYGCGGGGPCVLNTHFEIWDDDGGLADGDDPIEVNFGVSDGYCNGNDLQFAPYSYSKWWGCNHDQWVTLGWF